MEDDWMNPEQAYSANLRPRKDGTFYLIERKRRIPVTGNVGYLERWDQWAEFDNKDERDEALANLRETTQWVLRGSRATYIGGQILPGSDPRETIDI